MTQNRSWAAQCCCWACCGACRLDDHLGHEHCRLCAHHGRGEGTAHGARPCGATQSAAAQEALRTGSAEEGDGRGGLAGRAEHSHCFLAGGWGDPLGPCHDTRRDLWHQHVAAAAPAHSTEMGSAAAARHRGSVGAAHTVCAERDCNAALGDSSAPRTKGGTRREAWAVGDGGHAHGSNAGEAGADADSLVSALEDSSAQLGRDAHRVAAAEAADSRIAVGRGGCGEAVRRDVPVLRDHDRERLHDAGRSLDCILQKGPKLEAAAAGEARSRSLTW